MKATFRAGQLHTVHPNPDERDNLDDADDVRDLTLGELFQAIVRRIDHSVAHVREGTDPMGDLANQASVVGWIDANLVCQLCGGAI